MTEAVNTNVESDEHKIDEANISDLSGAASSTFPQKLFAMSLQEFDEGEVIHWLPHGLAFKVADSDTFSEEVIPKYFKRTSLFLQITYSLHHEPTSRSLPNHTPLASIPHRHETD